MLGLCLFFTMIGRMITEREQKLKEGLRMIGTSNSAYYGHWFAYSCIISLVYAVFLTSNGQLSRSGVHSMYFEI